MPRYRRHSTEVTSDRIKEAMDKWPDDFDGQDRDMASQIIHILEEIAVRERS